MVNDAVEAGWDAYFVGFIDCRDKVDQTYPVLDLSTILVPGKEEEGEEAGPQSVGVQRATIEESATTTEV